MACAMNELKTKKFRAVQGSLQRIIIFLLLKQLNHDFRKGRCKVRVIYRDEIGQVSVKLDENSVDFVDGIAYFDSEETSYRIPIEYIERIVSDN